MGMMSAIATCAASTVQPMEHMKLWRTRIVSLRLQGWPSCRIVGRCAIEQGCLSHFVAWHALL